MEETMTDGMLAGCVWPVVARVPGLSYQHCSDCERVEGVTAELVYGGEHMRITLIGADNVPRQLISPAGVDPLLVLRIMYGLALVGAREVLSNSVFRDLLTVQTDRPVLLVAHFGNEAGTVKMVHVEPPTNLDKALERLGPELVEAVQSYSPAAEELDELLLNLSVNGAAVDWGALEGDVGRGRASYTSLMQRRIGFLSPVDYLVVRDRLGEIGLKEQIVWDNLRARFAECVLPEPADDLAVETLNALLRYGVKCERYVSDIVLVVAGISSRLGIQPEAERFNIPFILQCLGDVLSSCGWEVTNPQALYERSASLVLEALGSPYISA